MFYVYTGFAETFRNIRGIVQLSRSLGTRSFFFKGTRDVLRIIQFKGMKDTSSIKRQQWDLLIGNKGINMLPPLLYNA